jgi:hypothetical protein
LLKEKARYPKDLRELVELYAPQDPIPLAIQRVLDSLPDVHLLGGPAGLTHQSILQNLGINQQQFETHILDGMVVEPRGGIYKPYNRARHVVRNMPLSTENPTAFIPTIYICLTTTLIRTRF